MACSSWKLHCCSHSAEYPSCLHLDHASEIAAWRIASALPCDNDRVSLCRGGNPLEHGVRWVSNHLFSVAYCLSSARDLRQRSSRVRQNGTAHVQRMCINLAASWSAPAARRYMEF
jgi:hypothetical protein